MEYTEQAGTAMYADTATWSPFQGCEFDCVYCRPTFQKQAKRKKRSCSQCYRYEPHQHPSRLKKIPSKSRIFVCGNSDLSFAPEDYVRDIIEAIRTHCARARKRKEFYLQSKRPECFAPHLEYLPGNVILVTTLETNRDEGYERISKAPVPSERYRQFLGLNYPRKVLTIEPVADFDLDVMKKWIIDLNPIYLWIGYNSHVKSVNYPEPDGSKITALVRHVEAHGIPVRAKRTRDLF